MCVLRCSCCCSTGCPSSRWTPCAAASHQHRHLHPHDPPPPLLPPPSARSVAANSLRNAGSHFRVPPAHTRTRPDVVHAWLARAPLRRRYRGAAPAEDARAVVLPHVGLHELQPVAVVGRDWHPARGLQRAGARARARPLQPLLRGLQRGVVPVRSSARLRTRACVSPGVCARGASPRTARRSPHQPLSSALPRPAPPRPSLAATT